MGVSFPIVLEEGKGEGGRRESEREGGREGGRERTERAAIPLLERGEREKTEREQIYRIRSIRRRGYYLFHRPSLCGVYSRAATIRERRLLIPVAAREAILRETVD